MIAHLENVVKANKGDIMVGGLITTLVEALVHDRESINLEVVVGNIVLDIFFLILHII